MYTLDDISISIWSGKEFLHDRLEAACSTWVRQFNEVSIYSDFFTDESRKILPSLSYPTKLNLIELGDCRQHLFSSGWVRAQPRFLKAMENSYRRNMSKKWYFFCDDDSFVIAPSILNIINERNHSSSSVIGHFFCMKNEVAWGMFSKIDKCLYYAKGGSGVIISNHYFCFVTLDKY